MILDAGFEGREHRVVTPDGYILSIHRLQTQHSQPGPVVFLQHGLFSSSADWVIGHRTKAFGKLRSMVWWEISAQSSVQASSWLMRGLMFGWEILGEISIAGIIHISTPTK